MILALDVGNSQIFCGVFVEHELITQFRHASTGHNSSDEIGVFLRGALRENDVDPEQIEVIAISSVVPELNYSLRACCQKYFKLEPMIMRPGLKTGLQIAYKDPKEVGSDRIADAMGAVKLYPDRNLIVIDFGTATTVCAVSRERVFLGGNIMPGVRLAMETLEQRTAKLPSVEIKPVRSAVGKTTIESIQSGLYWSNVGMVRELTSRISEEVFPNDPPLLIATGGFAHLFHRESLFDHVVPDLIFEGLLEALRLNGFIDQSNSRMGC